VGSTVIKVDPKRKATYGDQAERAKQLKANLGSGDLLVFYASLKTERASWVPEILLLTCPSPVTPRRRWRGISGSYQRDTSCGRTFELLLTDYAIRSFVARRQTTLL
jgi:hypothetical protein